MFGFVRYHILIVMINSLVFNVKYYVNLVIDNPQSMQRLLSLDVARGLGIAIIVVIHRVHYQWVGMRSTEAVREEFSGPWAPLIIFIIALFTMAGVFYFVSGVVNPYSIYGKVASGKMSVKKAVYGGLVSGLLLIFLNYLHRIFFMNGFVHGIDESEPEFPVGLLIGWIRNSER